MKEFLIEYWREILSLVGLAASIIICCIRKKPVKVVDTLKEIIVRLLPALICLAEKEPDIKGKAKMDFVLSNLKESLKEFGYGDDVITQYLPFAAEQVEVILSTPTKKGVIYGKKDKKD